MNRNLLIFTRLGCFAAVLLLAGLGQAQVTVSSNPLLGATGISTSAPVVFSFSGPVDTNQTTATFVTVSPFAELPVISAWNSSSNQLTCTPSPGFPANQTIYWSVDGQDADGNDVSTNGYFTTGTGGSGSTGSGTNAITSFGVSKIYLWDQSPAGALTNLGCFFYASSTLASNRTATNITLTLPTLVVTNLIPIPLHPETNYFSAIMASSNAFEASFPQGTNIFNVYAAASNQTVQVVLPLSMTQPNPPYITNLVAAQSVNATQSFVLGWQAFVGGTVTDYVNISITDTNGTNTFWKSPDPTTAGALNGTATTVTIPANTLQAASNYVGTVGFYHFVGVSNASYITQASRVTGTQFPLTTAGASAPLPVVTNYVKSGSSYSFDVLTATGQTLTVVSSTNCALPLAQWPVLLSANSPGASVHITDPRPATNRVMVYRVRNGT